MRISNLIVPVAALSLLTWAACYSTSVKPPKQEENPLAGTENEPTREASRNTAPPPTVDDDANMEAINAIANRLTNDAERYCSDAQYTGPRVVTTVSIVFMPNGQCEEVKLNAPVAGTRVGDCLKQNYSTAVIPPFKGQPVTVERTVDLTKKAAAAAPSASSAKPKTK